MRRQAKNEGTKDALRALYNPPARRPLRPDFPPLREAWEAAKRPGIFLDVIGDELEKHGLTLAQAGTIVIAYPHKHPGLFPGYNNNALMFAENFRNAMRRSRPDVTWVLADALCDTIHLNRSDDQSSLHALTRRQSYAIHSPSKEERASYLAPAATGKKNFFILIDNQMEQGTTLAHMISFIEHNGDHVLAAFADSFLAGYDLAQKHTSAIRGLSLEKIFGQAAGPWGRVGDLAVALSESSSYITGLRIKPEAALRELEKRLTPLGNSIFALTNEECNYLIRAVSSNRLSYKKLMSGLEAAAP